MRIRNATVFAIIAIMFILTYSKISNAEESPWSLNLYGASWHENSDQRHSAHQINPGIGLRYDISKHWYSEVNYIAKNSVKGSTKALGIGWHTEATKLNQKPLKLGLEAMYMDYSDPRPGKRDYSGIVPALTAEYVFTPETSGLVYLFNKKGKSVLFFGINVKR